MTLRNVLLDSMLLKSKSKAQIMTTKNLSTIFIPSATYWYDIRINARSRSKRERVGDLLRRWAGWIDGRETLSIDIDTLPVIGKDVKEECIAAMAKTLHKHVDAAVRDEMLENQIKRHMPTVCGRDKNDILRSEILNG
jgi:hypothetical protein